MEGSGHRDKLNINPKYSFLSWSQDLLFLSLQAYKFDSYPYPPIFFQIFFFVEMGAILKIGEKESG